MIIRCCLFLVLFSCLFGVGGGSDPSTLGYAYGLHFARLEVSYHSVLLSIVALGVIASLHLTVALIDGVPAFTHQGQHQGIGRGEGLSVAVSEGFVDGREEAERAFCVQAVLFR